MNKAFFIIIGYVLQVFIYTGLEYMYKKISAFFSFSVHCLIKCGDWLCHVSVHFRNTEIYWLIIFWVG